MTDVHNVYPGDERYPPEILRAFQDLESCSIVEFAPPFRLHRRHPRPAPETTPFSPFAPDSPFAPASSPEEARARSPRDVTAPASPQPGKSFHPFTPNTLPAGFSQALLAHLQSALASPHFTFHQLFSNFSNSNTALLRSPGRTLARVIQDLYILARALNIPLPTQSPAQSPSQSPSVQSVQSVQSVHDVNPVHPIPPSPSEKAQWAFETAIPNPQSDAPP